jgi:protein involved in polysaccharide export with SLBB domain
MNLQRAAAAALVSLVAIGTGCETKGWIDPTEMGRFQMTPQVVPILDKMIVGVEKDDVQFVGAREVTDDDLKVTETDYQIGPGDLLQISIMDLAGNGLQQVENKRVSQTGKISLPYLGQISVLGQSEAEIEDTIVRSYAEAQILPRAIVSVAMVESQNRIFTISGAVGQPGPYPLMRADFRLLDALASARGATSELGIDKVYIIRRKDVSSTDTDTNPGTPGVDPLAPQSRSTMPQTAVYAMRLQDAPAPQTPEEARMAAEELTRQINETRNQANNDPLTPPAPA